MHGVIEIDCVILAVCAEANVYLYKLFPAFFFS